MTISSFVILACPVCNYDRVMPTRAIFTALRLVAVLAVSYRRLDLVRTLGAFVIFEVFYYNAWRMAVWYSHPAVADGMIEWFGIASLILLSVGVPAFFYLYGLSRFRYFRAAQPVTLTMRHAALLFPLMILLSFAQGL